MLSQSLQTKSRIPRTDTLVMTEQEPLIKSRSTYKSIDQLLRKKMIKNYFVNIFKYGNKNPSLPHANYNRFQHSHKRITPEIAEGEAKKFRNKYNTFEWDSNLEKFYTASKENAKCTKVVNRANSMTLKKIAYNRMYQFMKYDNNSKTEREAKTRPSSSSIIKVMGIPVDVLKQQQTYADAGSRQHTK
jgi:hypothetical protein